jgi:polyisoprenoid-binding protein YceI
MFKYIIIGIVSMLYADAFNNSENGSFELEKNNASVLINGTSTLHNWTMQLRTFDCSADFLIVGSVLRNIDRVTFTCNATDLTSNKSLMDRRAYSALKSATYPEISFNMTSPIENTSGNNKFRDNLRGNLLVAGKSVEVSIPVEGALYNENGHYIIQIKGKTDLKMSDFHISPPAFALGGLETGDIITLTFSLQFLQKRNGNNLLNIELRNDSLNEEGEIYNQF